LVRGPVTGKYGRFSNLQEQLHEDVVWGLVKKMLEKPGLKDEGEPGILEKCLWGEKMPVHPPNA
jgi:hypothetical protein